MHNNAQENPAHIRPAVWLFTVAAALLCILLVCSRPQPSQPQTPPSPELAELHSALLGTINELNMSRRTKTGGWNDQDPDRELQLRLFKQMSDDRRTWIDAIESF